MRTTIEIPDTLFRKTKATAALRGSTMKELVVRAIEREIANSVRTKKGAAPRKAAIDTSEERQEKLDLSNFDFDDLLS